jgi:ketosteroid isomerase-like protein
MRRLPILCLLLLASCAPSTPGSLSTSQATAIRDSLQATLAAYVERLNAADRDSLIRFYADDPRFSWTADGRVSTHSVAEVRAQFDALAGFTRWHIEYHNPLVVPLAPGLATATTEYSMTLGSDTGTAAAFDGALTMIWVDTPRGWKILGGHSSSARPAGR